MTLRNIASATICTAALATLSAQAQTVTPLRFGDFENWVTRHIKESAIIGGNTKTVYEIGPAATDNTGKPYSPRGGSPWATSNVLAKVSGITKASNAVSPDSHPGHGKAAKLSTIMERVKALGIINLDVLVTGSIFTGVMFEPIKSTKNPYKNMEFGVPYTGRPSALKFDYKVVVPNTGTRTYSSGFGSKKTYQGTDHAEVYIILQRRWEDAKGNLFAKRVGTARETYGKSTNGWVEGHRIPIHYGNASGKGKELIPEASSMYARNSKGKLVPVKEVGWDDAGATPTHMIIMASAGSGQPYTGTEGLTLWVDNFGLVK